VTACKFAALVKDSLPGGPPVRDAPQQDGREVGRLPATDDNRGQLPEIQVIGFKDGWFLIEGADYPESDSSQLYTGRGWLEGKFVTTRLFRDTLKKAPSNASPDVSHLYGTREGIPYQPYGLEVQRVFGCSGPWLEVEIDHLSQTPGLPSYIISELHHHPDRVRVLIRASTGVTAEHVRPMVIQKVRRQIAAAARAGTLQPIDPEQFIVNLLSLCVFPFAARPMIMVLLGLDANGFEAFIKTRRSQLAPFFLRGLRA
jgi:hypothetical protein